MEFQLLNIVQCKILTEVGKKFVLPLFIKNIAEITDKIFSLKKTSSVISNKLKLEIEETDLEYKILTIASFLQEISEENYKSKTIHIHLDGIYEILENIKKELIIINEECEYIKTSWYYYIIGWSYFTSNINIQNLKSQIYLLNTRYNMLLKILTIQKK